MTPHARALVAEDGGDVLRTGLRLFAAVGDSEVAREPALRSGRTAWTDKAKPVHTDRAGSIRTMAVTRLGTLPRYSGGDRRAIETGGTLACALLELARPSRGDGKPISLCRCATG